MPERHLVLNALYHAVDVFNQQAPTENRLEKDPEAPVFGPQGRLDSLGLVNFIVVAEEALQDAFQVPLTLADDAAMSQRHSPFRSLSALADYATELLQAPDNG